MAQNWLKLNDDKTEFIIIGSPCNLKKAVTEYIVVGDHKIFKSKQVRNMGAILTLLLQWKLRSLKTAQTAWYHLYSISKIRPYLTTEQTRCVIHAYVTSRLDQNNSLLSGVPETTLLCKLQKVQNDAAKLILGRRKWDHATPFLQELHWLPVSQHYIFKTVLLVYKTLQGDSLSYLQDLLKPCLCDRDGMRSADDITHLDEPTTQYKTFGDCAFSVFGPKMWKMLPKDVRLSTSYSLFSFLWVTRRAETTFSSTFDMKGRFDIRR